MTIEEQLKVLNNEFQKLHSKFMSFDTQLKGIDSKYDALKVKKSYIYANII